METVGTWNDLKGWVIFKCVKGKKNAFQGENDTDEGPVRPWESEDPGPPGFILSLFLVFFRSVWILSSNLNWTSKAEMRRSMSHRKQH